MVYSALAAQQLHVGKPMLPEVASGQARGLSEVGSGDRALLPQGKRGGKSGFSPDDKHKDQAAASPAGPA